jgi:hypothetical protein
MKVWLLAEHRENDHMIVTSAHKTLRSAKKRQRSLGIHSAHILEQYLSH